MNIIKDNSSGLTNEVILSCTDRLQLLQWKNELYTSICEISDQIEKYEFAYNPELGHSDFKWYIGATTILKIKKRLSRNICTQIGKVKLNTKTENYNKNNLKKYIKRSDIEFIISKYNAIKNINTSDDDIVSILFESFKNEGL